MKKIVALLLATVMVFLLVACGSDPKDDGVKQDDPAQTVAPSEENPKNDNDEEEPVQKTEVSRGKIENGVYTNDFLGFKFTKPALWVYSTDEEIAAMLNLSAEMLGEKFSQALENNQTMYDMMVMDTLSRSSINVGYENLAMSLATNITEEQYAEVVKALLSNSYGATGMTYEFTEELDIVNLGEAKFTRLIYTVEYLGDTMTQVYYLRKVDKYMAYVIVTIPSGYTVQEIEAMFQ